MGYLTLKFYAPAKIKYGFHFKSLDAMNFTPVIRSSIRKARVTDKGHYTVYLPAFSDKEILKILDKFSHIHWEVFSKKCTVEYEKNNIHFFPVSLEKFSQSFVNCTGILCSAGFETPAEALFMGKKLCVVPMKNQYEQACNGAFLNELGIQVIWDVAGFHNKLQTWLSEKEAFQISYPDQTREIIHSVVKRHQK